MPCTEEHYDFLTYIVVQCLPQKNTMMLLTFTIVQCLAMKNTISLLTFSVVQCLALKNTMIFAVIYCSSMPSAEEYYSFLCMCVPLFWTPSGDIKLTYFVTSAI